MRILGGLGAVTAANAAAWRDAAARADEGARALLVPLVAGALACVVCADSLAVLGGPA